MCQSHASQFPGLVATITLINHSTGSFELSYQDKEEKNGLERGIDVVIGTHLSTPTLDGVPWCSLFFFSFGVLGGDQGNSQKGFSLISDDPFSL